ncbi:MAG: Rv2175c family DNA-binding protein [Frankiaceae bacterium]
MQTDIDTGALEALVGEWLPVPDVAEYLGVGVSQVRGLIRSGQVIALRVGEPPVLRIPAAFLQDGALIRKLTGTLSLLRDQSFSDAEAVRWLFTPDDSLPGTPVQALRDNRGTEVRRRAQALGF